VLHYRVFNEQQQLTIRSIMHAYAPTIRRCLCSLGCLKRCPGVRILAVAPSDSAADLFVKRLFVSISQRKMLCLNTISHAVCDTPEVVRENSKVYATESSGRRSSCWSSQLCCGSA